MERPEADLEILCTRIREALASESAAQYEPREERAAFLEEVARRSASPAFARSPGRVRRRWLPVTLAVSLGAAAAGVWLWTRPVSFQVGEAHAGRLGDVIQSQDGQPMPLHFSDGSRLLLHERGRMRVLALASDAARVLVEDGTLDVSIAHPKSHKTRWDFEAGPYHVVVTGTRFQMAFRARDQQFSLSTQEGQVVVFSDCQQAPRKVLAGERVDLICPDREAPASTNDSSPGKAVSVGSPIGNNVSPAGVPEHGGSAERPSAEPLPPAPPSNGAAQTSRRARDESAWRGLLASGKLAEGLRAAERSDFQRVCQIATARELLALADAARLFGPHLRGITALRILRQRFSGTTDASTAAFRLGLMAFEKDQAYAQAARWFEIYLREQPSGPLMGDSFGRLMEARLHGGDLEGARSDAQQYLRRFPEGPYASEARGILSR
jgi:transmembrane sensor